MMRGHHLFADAAFQLLPPSAQRALRDQAKSLKSPIYSDRI
jgi:hypothetical protein